MRAYGYRISLFDVIACLYGLLSDLLIPSILSCPLFIRPVRMKILARSRRLSRSLHPSVSLSLSLSRFSPCLGELSPLSSFLHLQMYASVHVRSISKCSTMHTCIAPAPASKHESHTHHWDWHPSTAPSSRPAFCTPPPRLSTSSPPPAVAFPSTDFCMSL